MQSSDDEGDDVTSPSKTDEVTEEAAEAIKILKSMEAMAVVRNWKVEAEPEGEVVAYFTSITGGEETLTVDELRGYSWGFGAAFRFFTERNV